MAYAACGHGQNSAKSTWSRRLTPPVAMGKTVQKAPGVDSKRRLWPCERSGGAKGFGPLQATCPAPLATRGGLEHVRHLGLGRWLQVAWAPPSHLHAGPLATPGGLEHVRHLGVTCREGLRISSVRVLLNRNVLYTASAPHEPPSAPPQSTLATLPRSQHTTSARPTKLCMAWFTGGSVARAAAGHTRPRALARHALRRGAQIV